MSPLERPVPPVAEEIHLPGPSLKPVLLSVGLTVGLVGVTVSTILLIAGGVLALAVTLSWISDVRHDVDELPPGH